MTPRPRVPDAGDLVWTDFDPTRSKEQAGRRPAPPRIGVQLYNNAIFNMMIVKLAKNKEQMKDVLDWAENEINGYISM